MRSDEAQREPAPSDASDPRRRIHLDRHGPVYRTDFVRLSDELHAGKPIAWNDTHGGYWVVSGNQELMDVARRADVLPNPAGTVHYETIGMDNGMRHQPATSPPGRRLGPGLDETIGELQRLVDEQWLAEPVTARRERARLDG